MNNVLNRLKEISSAVMYAAEANDIEVVLERIAEVSRELAGTRYAALGVPDGRGGLRYFKVAGMEQSDIEQMEHLPRGYGLIGAIMRERKPIIINKITMDKRSAGFPDNHPSMHSFLGVPIQVGDQLFGMLYLTDKLSGAAFDEQDQMLIETMAGYAALAIAGAELSEKQSRLRLLEERERIGMELHDGVIQSLYGLGMQVDLLRQTSDTVDPEELRPVIRSLNEVIGDIRGYIAELRERDKGMVTIYDKLKHMTSKLHSSEKIEVVIDAPHQQPIFPPAVFESICLIVNEALSNAVRHSHASCIHITGSQNKEHLKIIIEDDGVGFDIEEIRGHSGLGLRNMQHRARLYGGHVDIESSQGEGTRLHIEIPVQ